MKQAYLTVTGNMMDGFTFYGPFDHGEEATEWSGDELEGLEYWVGKIYDPLSEPDNLTPEDKSILLEIAHEALKDADLFDHMANKMDLANDIMVELREKVNKICSK